MVVRHSLLFLFGLLNFYAYAQYRPTKLLLHIEDVNGHPLTGMFSVSVCDADIVPVDSDNATGMAELLLCSEIKGRVENPNHYFKDNSSRTLNDLDLLLMTQGWRRYDIHDIIEKRTPVIINGIEESQSIIGHVTATMKKQPKNISLSLFNPQTFQRQTINLGDSSRFTLTGLDLIDGESVTIEATKASGSGSFIQLHIDTIPFPQLNFLGDTLRHQDSKIYNYACQSFEKLKFENIYKTIDFPDVLVKTKKRYRNRKGIAARGLMSGDSKIERFSDVQSMLRWLGILVRINNEGKPYFGKQSATFVGEPFTLTPTYIDDHKVEQEELWDIIPQNIDQVEYLTPNDPSNNIYSNEAVTAGCLLIYLKDGKKNKQSKEDKLNVAYVTPLGYQPPAEFYNPKRSNSSTTPSTPNLRTTLYWNPKVRTDDTGNAEIDFCSSEKSKRYLVTIEGIADDGTMVSNQAIIVE